MRSSFAERLNKRADFVAVAAAGKRYITPAFILQAYQRPSEESFRVGITASRKVGGAVERNRAKRRLRALIRTVFPSKAYRATDYVLIARQEVLKRNFPVMEKELQVALVKLNTNMSLKQGKGE